MSLLKKIIILVNLILCMLCINVFAEVTTDMLTGAKEIISQYENDYYVLFHQGYSGGSYFIRISTTPLTVRTTYNTILEKDINEYYYYGVDRKETMITYKWSSTNNSWSAGTSSNYGQIEPSFTDELCFYTNFDIYYCDVGSSPSYVYHESRDIYNLGNTTPSFDDTTFDWSQAFSYYITAINSSEAYSYLDSKYASQLNIYMKANSLNGLLNSEELMNNNTFYLIKFNVTFKFKQSDGTVYMYPLDISPSLSYDMYYDLEIPYLVGNIAENPGGNVIYDGLNEFILNGALDKYIVADRIDRSVGLINYDVLIQPYVVKQITYPEYSEEIIYTYDIITVSNDITADTTPLPEDSVEKVVPDNLPKEEKEKIYYIIGPNGDIVDVVDKSVKHDFDDEFNIVDNDTGDIVVRPTINEETGDFELLDPNGNVVGDSTNKNNRPTWEEIVEETNKNNYYDIGSIINGLKTDLQELVSNDGSLSKMFAWFRQIFEWLPFDILKIFGMIISFFIIFEFIHIIRK